MLLVFLLGLALVLVLIVPLVQGQIVHLLARFPIWSAPPRRYSAISCGCCRSHLPAAEADKVHDVVSNRIGDAVSWFAGLFQSMITSSFAILSILSLVVVTPIVSFFLLRDWHR